MSHAEEPTQADIKYLEGVVGKGRAEDVAWVLFDTGASVRDDSAVSDALSLLAEIEA